MARLLAQGEWFESVFPESIYEIDFESTLLAQGSDLYPEFYLVPYKKLVSSEHGDGKPDLALVDKQYRNWWVVEVELGSHPLSHVERQVAIFSRGVYGDEDAKYLAEKRSELNESLLAEMMKGEQPRVLVLVNQAMPEWSAELARWDALVGVVELFRSRRNQVILRINGVHPSPVNETVVSTCRMDQLLPRALKVDSPANLGVAPGDEVLVRIEGGMTRWARVDSEDAVWLMPVMRCPLPHRPYRFILTRGADGTLILNQCPEKLRRPHGHQS